MKTWKEMTWRERLATVALSALPAVIILLLAQTFAYMTIYRDARVEDDPLTGTPALYEMTFGRGWFRQTTATPLNAMGFPDDEFVDIGPKGDCIHVVFAGDSFTFGDAVDRHRNFVSLVRRAAGRSYPDRCIRVFNIAERMTTVDDQAMRIRETRPILQPDIVILGQYQNDITDLTIRGHDAPAVAEDADEGPGWWGRRIWTRVPLANSSLVRYLTFRAFAFMITRDIKYDVLAQWSVLADPASQDLARQLTSIYRELYLELVDELRADGVGFGVIIMPSKLDILAGEYPEGEFFEAIAREADVPYLSVFAALDRSRREYPFQMYDGHLSIAGNEVVAREAFQWMFDANDPVPFPVLREPAALRADTALLR